MEKINAVITGISAYVPDYILTNEELSTMVDTNDEWIMSRVGIKERRILKEEGKGTSYMGIKAMQQLMEKTNSKPEEIDAIIFATTTPDHFFPATATIVANELNVKNAFCFDMEAACTGFVYGLELASSLIKSGKYKKIVLISGDKLSSITNYEDRNTCPLFGDGVGATMIEPTTEDIGIKDVILRADGSGGEHLIMAAGGSANPTTQDTIDKRLHFVNLDGRTVFKHAVSSMSDVSEEIIKRNSLTSDDIAWYIPHQANMRIIEATAKRMNFPMDRVIVNIQKYGNTSAGSIPICLWEWEDKLKKGDKIVLSAFGAGFTWGAAYIEWGYDSKK